MTNKTPQGWRQFFTMPELKLLVVGMVISGIEGILNDNFTVPEVLLEILSILSVSAINSFALLAITNAQAGITHLENNLEVIDKNKMIEQQLGTFGQAKKLATTGKVISGLGIATSITRSALKIADANKSKALSVFLESTTGLSTLTQFSVLTILGKRAGELSRAFQTLEGGMQPAHPDIENPRYQPVPDK